MMMNRRHTQMFQLLLTHVRFPLHSQVSSCLGLSGQRFSQQWTWAGHSDFYSSRLRLQPGIPPGRWIWRCQPRCLWSFCRLLCWTEIIDDVTENLANIFIVASTFLSTFLRNIMGRLGLGGWVGGWGARHIPGCSPMVKLNVAGMEEPLALTAVTSTW